MKQRITKDSKKLSSRKQLHMVWKLYKNGLLEEKDLTEGERKLLHKYYEI